MATLTVNQALDLMNRNRGIAKKKGDYGEAAAVAVIRDYIQERGSGSYLLQSVTYPYAKSKTGKFYPGNINFANGQLTEVMGREGIHDEIDLLLVTSNRIFAIEVKARTGTWKLYDFWGKQNSTKVDKYPIAQSEKHARHLYHQIYEYIPDGESKYIVPLTVFVDKAVIYDERNDKDKEELPIAILNNLKKVILKYDVPQGYSLHLSDIRKRLGSIAKFTEC